MKVKRFALPLGSSLALFAIFFAIVGVGTVLAAQPHMNNALSSLLDGA